MSTERIKVGDEVKFFHSNLTYKVVRLGGEKVWVKETTGVVGFIVVDKKYLIKVRDEK